MRWGRAVARLRRRAAKEEEGFSLVELVVGIGVMGIVLAILFTTLATVQSRVALEQDRGATVDQARLAIEQLDREIRSGNLVYDPAAESPASFSLRVYTQANGNTRVPSTQCVQWRIENSELKRRSYQVVGGVATVIANWRVVATGIVNRDVTPTVPAFSLQSGGRVVDILLLSNSHFSSARSKTIRIQTSVAIRNSSTGNPCTPIPSG